MEKKICKKCGVEKELSEFHLDNSKKDLHKNICKKCLSQKHYQVSDVDRNIRQSLIYCMKNDGGFRWGKFLGYGKKELREHIESLFKEGMTWENYGEVWSVTFIIPKRCYKFNSLKDEEFTKCWALKNLKPEFNEIISKQKVEILLEDVNKHSLWDILPKGKINIVGDIYQTELQKSAKKVYEEYIKLIDKNQITE